ncbi:hypothetical protein [Kitasatospora sp. GP82]|uniref:hypothetical protein n=1 Tax=Kitasatospora sp. GP82 TaxID=3035089 RepID=UPI002472EEF9|nr:hypothetical protein [Kitasatospora sp. GP82]MDH6130467.1 hypothetical protein [Kitasatospora sp. GP82]
MAVFLLVLIAAALGILGAVVRGLLYLLAIGILLLIADGVFLAVCLARRRPADDGGQSSSRDRLVEGTYGAGRS